MSEWVSTVFGKVARRYVDIVNPADIPPDTPYIGLEHIEPGTLRLSSWGIASDTTSSKLRFDAGDVIYGKLRPYFRKVCRPAQSGVCTTEAWVLRPATGVDSRYLFYLSATPAFSKFATRASDGTRMPRAQWTHVANYPVLLPPLSEQRAIAEVLGALDDKIEANRRVAEYSRRLAIAEGIDCLSRFPGRLVALEQVATTVKGVSYRSEDLVPGGGWLVSLKCVGRDGSFRANGLKPFSGVAKVSQFVEEGDILVAQTDLTQRAEVIGRPIRIAKLGLIGHLVASLDFVIVRPESGLANETLFAILSQQEFRDHALGYCNGTTVLHMNSRGVPSFEFALPPPEGIAQITSVMRPLLKRSDTAQRESQLLEQLRDTLLPKLLSGELRVRDAEPLAEDAV